jgi:predicted TIM-barrel fold metal-dependent hydrolase
MRFDIHTHAFHPKISARVLEQLEDHYSIQPVGTGVIGDLLTRARKAGLDKVAVLCAATSPAQVIPANAYALRLHAEYREVVAFGTLHPAFPDWEHQLERLKTAGIPGIKLHPEFQGFRLDDPRLLPFFEQGQNDFIFQIHIGDRKAPEHNPSCPYKLAAILDAFPKLRVVAAHLGGWMQWEHSLKVLAGRDLWLETSSCMDFIDDATLRAILRKHPREKLLFGSDYPLFDPSEECRKLQMRAALSDGEMETILTNAGALFA